MSVEQAKKLILESFARDSTVGTSPNFRYIMVHQFNRNVAKDDLEEAIKDLYAEGILTIEGRLTEQGYKLLFPSDIAELKRKVINELRAQRLRVNDMINMKNFNLNFMIHLNTQDRKDLDEALDQLVLEGVLELRNKNFVLLRSL